MRFSGWAVPVVLRLLSLAGLTSAGETRTLAVGFALSATNRPTSTSSSQPRDPLHNLSLDLDFFVRVQDHDYRLPIMPLHLLPKKSWNVYNTANIERVRRDEAAAQALEEAEEQRLQEQDAARRMAILRGEVPPPLAIEDAPAPSSRTEERIEDSSARQKRDRGHDDEYSRRVKKPRRKYGENETDFEMRVASQRTAPQDEDKQVVLHKASADAPITDSQGHISLFPPSSGSARNKFEKNVEVEAEATRKKREYEDQYTMRFSNAAGFKNDIAGKAWYDNADKLGPRLEDEKQVGEVQEVGKDVWGNEDPRRKEREAKRVVDNDPLAFMKRGAAQVRQVEKERRQWKLEKEREIKELEDAERRRRKEKKRRRERERERGDYSDDDLDDFRLDHDEEDRDREERRARRKARERERREDRNHREKHHRRSEHEHRRSEHDHSRRDRSRERSSRTEEVDYRYKHRRQSD